MSDDRFLESCYDGVVYDTVTEQDYVVFNDYVLSDELMESLDEEYKRLKELEKEKGKLVIRWSSQIDDISEMLKSYYDGAYRNGDYDVMNLLDDMISAFENIDSFYIGYRDL